MFIESFIDKGLGNSAYLVGSHEAKVAVMIDPLRDIDRYLATAERLGVTITHVLETHLHNDFISGAREMAAQIGAFVAASAEAQLGFEHRPLLEGDSIPLGPYMLNVMATPGHTPEHLAFMLRADDSPKPLALFSGGALMVGGAARTDLLGPALAQPLAHALYHTLFDKLLTLPDDVPVYPTHGAGSFCAAPASVERVTTIGQERVQNRLAQAQSAAEFVELALNGLPSYPCYFAEMRPINRRGPQVLGGIPALQALSAQAVHDAMVSGAVVVDTRPVRETGQMYIPGSYRIPLTAPLGTWAGWLIPFRSKLILVAEEERDYDKAIRQLIRIGYDDLRGYLEGGLVAWQAAGLPIERLNVMSISELRARLLQEDAPIVLDVRQDAEWRMGHIPGAIHIENGRLPYDDLPLPRDRPIAVHCHTQNRSPAAVSVLMQRGYHNVLLIPGGLAAWQAAGGPVETEEVMEHDVSGR